jgi:hypothetical protein
MQKVTLMTRKAILYAVVASLFLVSCTAKNEEQYDTRAIESLDAMAEVIGELSACSYTLKDVNVNEDGSEFYNVHDVYMRGPNKMYIHSNGTKGERSYWYDGTVLAYYSFDKDTYAEIDAPENIMETIRYVHDKYGVRFPAADFFYPSFTDDILTNFDQVLFLGDELIDGIESTSILASRDTLVVQIWIDKASNLPLRLSIESIGDTAKFYEATFSNFRSNPDLPDLMFESDPPTDSEKSELKAIK